MATEEIEHDLPVLERTGPGEYFAHHPKAYAASMVGAGAAAAILAARSVRTERTSARLGWAALSGLEAAIAFGIWRAHHRALRAA